MKYPCLVPKRLCKTDICVRLESESISNLGEPEQILVLNLKCNYQDAVKTVLTSEKKLVQIFGTALFPGDIAPGWASISGGTVTVFGKTRQIAQGMKARNPDGTVNYCKLEVI